MTLQINSIQELYQITLPGMHQMTLQKNLIQLLYQITLPGTASNDITKKFNPGTISNNITRNCIK